MKVLWIAYLLVVSASGAHAQAFGTHQGMTLSDFPGASLVSQQGTMSGYLIAPPDANPVFETYLASFSDSLGLCAVSGLTKPLSAKVGAAFALTFRDQLTDIYGLPDHTSLGFSELTLEMLLNVNSNRDLKVVWLDRNDRKLPQELSSISMAFFTSGNKFQLGVSYLFNNMAGDYCVEGGNKTVITNKGL